MQSISAMIDNSKMNKNLRALIRLAAQLPTASEREDFLDRVIQNALMANSTQDLLQLNSVMEATAAQPEDAQENGFVDALQSLPLITNTDPKLPQTVSVDTNHVSVKRSRGRPRLKPKPKYDPKYGVLNLLDTLSITHPMLRKQLEKLAIAARTHSAGGRGIPQTETPETFRFLRRGGPAPKPRLYLIDGVPLSVSPPIISKGSGGEANAIWVEYEKLLTGIEDEADDPEVAMRRESVIRSSAALKKLGIHWIEGVPTIMASIAVPTIHAETARKILRGVPLIATQAAEFIDLAPASWFDPETGWTDTFARIVREAYLGKIREFGRRERIALARMLLQSLGRIEYAMFEIAFKNSIS